MKKLAYLTIVFAAISYCSAQTFPENHDWKASLKIIDDAGLPVSGASVSIFYDVPLDSTNIGKIAGLTDTSGEFTASHRDSTYGLRFFIEKPGYYSTDLHDDFGGFFTPEKLNPNLTLMLKKIIHPIPMYAKRVNENPPILNQPVGYDLTTGDWVAPYGKGINTDIIFTKVAYRKSGADYEYKVTVDFKNAGDGIQAYTIPESEKGGGLQSSHEAPIDGYQNQLIKDRSAHPGEPTKSNYDENAKYFFRVRTVLDENGNVKSALYGKIYGDFMQFTYYLNPTSNDRNVEFDPKQNLLSLKFGEPKVTMP